MAPQNGNNGQQNGQQQGQQQGQQNGQQNGQQGQQGQQNQGQQQGQQNGQQQGQQNGQQQGQQNGQQNGQQGQQGQQNQGQQQGQDQGQQQGQQGQQGQQNQGQQQGQDQGQQQGQQGQQGQGQGQQDQGQQNQGQQGQGNNQNGQQSGHDNNDNNNNNDNNRGGDRNGHQSGDNNRDQHRDGNNRSGGGESGLSTSTSVIIASSVSVVSTLLLVILAIWLWRRRQKKRKWSNLTGSNSKGFHEKRPISQPTDRRPISPPADRPPIPPSLAISTPVTALPKYTPPEEPSPVSPVSPEPPARNSCYGFAKSKPVPRNKPGSPGERRAASIAWKSSNPPYVAPKDVSGVGLRSAASLERSPSPPQPAHLPNGRRSRAGLEYNKTDGDYDEDDVEVARAVRSTPQMTVTPPDTSPADQRVRLDNLGSSHTVVGDPGRWSWTNSQAPSTPRIPAPSPQGSVSNIRAVAAWFRGGGRSANDNEKNFSLPDRGGSKPLLKNHAQRPVLAPTQFVQQEIPSPARPRVSDVFRSSIPSTPTTASSSSREGGVTLSGDRRLT